MRFGWDDTCLAHDPGPRHPERPDRLRAIREGLTHRHGVDFVTAVPADRSAITGAHDEDYLEDIESFCRRGGGNWDPDTVATEETWPAALQSAGLAIWAAIAALEGADGRATAFALGRPPGHHATASDAMGFCFLNNAAIAATEALEAGAERVAVVDWDVHHGNGTQEIFVDRGDVAYLSLHEAGLYPGTGKPEEVGVGDGEGTTVNLPLPPGSGDADYRAGLEEVVGPVVGRFDPDVILVSAGFDAHRHDPISRMHVTTEGYGWFTHRLDAIAAECDAGLGFVLEGGYNLESLADGVGMVHEVFDGYEPIIPDEDPTEAVGSLVAELRDRHGLG